MSPSELSIKHAKGLGYHVEHTEQTIRIPFGRTFKRDYMGVADFHFVNTTEILAVQASDWSNHSHRREKCMASKLLALWLAGPGRRFEIWTWQTRRSLERTKAGKRSKRLVHHLRREEITLAMFVPQQAFSEGGSAQEEQPREALT